MFKLTTLKLSKVLFWWWFNLRVDEHAWYVLKCLENNFYITWFVLSTWWLENGFDQGFSLMGFGNQSLMRLLSWWVQKEKFTFGFEQIFVYWFGLLKVCGKLFERFEEILGFLLFRWKTFFEGKFVTTFLFWLVFWKRPLWLFGFFTTFGKSSLRSKQDCLMIFNVLWFWLWTWH